MGLQSIEKVRKKEVEDLILDLMEKNNNLNHEVKENEKMIDIFEKVLKAWK